MKNIGFLLLLLISFNATSQNLYKVMLTRAAPGKLENLIELLKVEISASNSVSQQDACLLRHSQGDQWDLMTIVPAGSSMAEYAGSESYKFLEPDYGSAYYESIARQETAYMWGPDFQIFNEYITDNGFFHIEMFISLAGMQTELQKEREMENDYLKMTNRKPNLIFIRETGFAFDLFTLGAYPDLLSYAKGGNQPLDLQEKAAVKAGFSSASDIGFYLRKLISEHHDTLANKVVLNNP